MQQMNFKDSEENVLKECGNYNHLEVNYALFGLAVSLKRSLDEALEINKRLLLGEMIPISQMASDERPRESGADQMVKLQEEYSLKYQNFEKPSKRKPIQKPKPITVKNDTKNIPKNFGTAISIFIKKKPNVVKKLLSKRKVSYTHFLQFNRSIKFKLNSLIDLRAVWTTTENDPNKDLKQCFRILSYEFLKRYCLEYIFDSRIKNIGSHIRYRTKLLDGLKNPSELTNLKDY